MRTNRSRGQAAHISPGKVQWRCLPLKVNKPDYTALLPKRIHCSDNPKRGLVTKMRDQAVEYAHVQANGDSMRSWLLFDGDMPGAWFLPEEKGLPTPTYTAINPDSSRAHFGYLLAEPVTFSANAREGPMRFFLAVERGFTRRLGADNGFSHHITKNPVHPRWITDWQAVRPYRLDELNDSLEPEDRKWIPLLVEGTGRNCTVFHTLRQIAYREVLGFKRKNQTYETFRDFLKNRANDINRTFPIQLWEPELRGVVNSVAQWAWKKFGVGKQSLWQFNRWFMPP